MVGRGEKGLRKRDWQIGAVVNLSHSPEALPGLDEYYCLALDRVNHQSNDNVAVLHWTSPRGCQRSQDAVNVKDIKPSGLCRYLKFINNS